MRFPLENNFGRKDFDLVKIPKYKTVILIDSCFWHGCKKHGSIPATRTKFWTEKIDRNKTRDKEVNKHYKKDNWKIIRDWEHDLPDHTKDVIQRI